MSLSPSLAAQTEVYEDSAVRNFARAQVFLSGSGHVNGPVTKTAAAYVLFALISIGMTSLFFFYSVYYEKEYFSDAYEEKHGVSK